MPTKRKPKIYYLPGMISLIGLPILCIYFFAKNPIFNKNRVLLINTWNEEIYDESSENSYTFPEKFKSKILYTDIELNDNRVDNSIKIDFAKITLKEILIKEDTTKGIHFSFNNEMPYEYFVRVWESNYFKGNHYIVSEKNDFWLFYFVPKEILKEQEFLYECEGINLSNCVPTYYPNGIQAEERKQAISSFMALFKTYYSSIILFVLLIVLFIFRLKAY